MPTMIQKFQCEACEEVYETTAPAELCVRAHPDAWESGIRTLTLWQCDEEICQATFDNQFAAERCEAEHETADADGRPGTALGGVREWLGSDGAVRSDPPVRTLWVGRRDGRRA
jgi:hypothetical protein